MEALGPQGVGRAVDTFRRRFWELWVDAHIARTPALHSFRGQRHEEFRAEFARLDESLRRAAVGGAIAGAEQRAAQINDATFAARDSQLGILRRELQKRRPRPLRRLFGDIPQVLQAIKPCMLMSPVSVSTYLAPGTIAFDLVIFDEASQLPPQEAIPSILRGSQAIVAGDNKQLPPTSFFSSALFAEESEEDDEAEDSRPLESLLDECEAARGLFHPAHLRWHYRSRDERLISFSNRTFYDGSLVTFPSPGSPPDRGVQLRYVDGGIWDRGKSRTNRREARVVAEVVIHHLQEHPKRSMGVVALNVTQKEAIEDALEEALAERPDLRPFLTQQGSEPFFVKSLENVQGDERDTIMISIGYGPDINGAVRMNFGPLNLEGGWRRLNVLVTRARYLTVLVTSLRSTQLSGVSSSNRGATALRQYIEYAERGCRLPAGPVQPTYAETNDFEEAVAAALRDRGLEVDEQVGASGFRIDLAVRDPRSRDWYLLGVECDGATYHSARTARDRDLLREQILRDMGWRLHRIWSVDWFRNPQAEVDAAMRAAERAMTLGGPEMGVSTSGDPQQPSSGTPTEAEAMRSAAPQPTTLPRDPPTDMGTGGEVGDSDPDMGPMISPSPAVPTNATLRYPAGTSYQTAPWRQPDRSLLLLEESLFELEREIIRVVEVEGPIHADYLLERLKSIHGVARAGHRIKGHYRRAVESAVRRRRVTLDPRNFLWPRQDTLNGFRVPSNTVWRDIEHIPPEELRLAVLHVVESQFGLPRVALIRETARLFGIGQVRANVAESIGDVADTLVEKGELRRSGFQVTLP